MPSHVTVCLQCGFNRATGTRLRTVRGHSSRRWAGRLLPLAGLLLAAGLGVAAFLGWRWYPGAWKKFQRERIGQAVTAVNDQYPKCAIGETVTLRRASGQAATGVLVGVGPDGVVLQSVKGRVASFPFYLLEPGTLLRFDDRLREEVVRLQVVWPEHWWERLWMLLMPPPWRFDTVLAERHAATRHCAFCQNTRQVACPGCGGRGSVSEAARKPCPQCKGTGQYAPRIGTGKSRCPFCQGAGYLADTHFNPCPTCRGTGRVPCPRCSPPAP
ncbi:MAG: hypothetical protein KA248_07455 [Kiritimatiellae bacterium]|nr:hypothetical protein [Kiritimatiellia bacterium]